MSRRSLRAPAFLLFALAAFALYWAVRLAWAEWLARSRDPARFEQALRWAPFEPRYWKRLAQLDPNRRVEALRRAVELNPYDSAAWIELGLLAEAARDLSRAENCLLKAAEVDRRYEPRWVLAGFYFRRGQAEAFWRWVREAAAISGDDPRPLFRLCWEFSQDPELILRRALPDRPAMLAAYLSFLLAENRIGAGAAVAARLLDSGGRQAGPVLLAYCERLVELGDATAALRLWNRMAERGLVRTRPLSPSRGLLLSNGDFAFRPLGAGFDWRLPYSEGVRTIWTGYPSGVKVSFSGRQPEQCELLVQFLPWAPAGRYRLRFHYRTAGIPAASGLRFEFGQAASPPLSSEQWRAEEFGFLLAEAAPLTKLVLAYRRPPGAVRIQGALWLAQVELNLIAAGGRPGSVESSKRR